MSTPHINAAPGEFAPAVLMPGDPKRAENMASTLMSDARVVSDVRGNRAFTGTVNGKPLSIMTSGMGQPSLAIYANELFGRYNVQRIIRVGTCGGYSPKVSVGDVVIAQGAHYEGLTSFMIPQTHFSAVADFNLLRAAADAAGDDPHVKVGMVVSRDRFYGVPSEITDRLVALGTLGVEMEAATLYGLATEYGRAALALLTVSDHVTVPSKDMTPEERESRFAKALALAVAAAHA